MEIINLPKNCYQSFYQEIRVYRFQIVKKKMQNYGIVLKYVVQVVIYKLGPVIISIITLRIVLFLFSFFLLFF
jgi:hypothetical protein